MNTNRNHSVIINIGDEELEVEYRYNPFRRGMRDSLCGIHGAGPSLEPDEPESIDIMSIKYKGEDIDDYLSTLILKRLSQFEDGE